MTLDSSTVLGAPGGTAPTFPTQGQDPQQPDAVRALIAHILQSAQQGSRQMAAPVPSPLPQQTPHPNPTPEGAYQKDWGFQRFAANVQNSIQQGVANHKAAQLAHAESQWNQLTVLMQDQSPQGQQKLNNWLIANQKSLKGMAKALNQDWLNPEKTDVWKEALKNVATQQQQKGQAASGMREMFKHLIGKATQPQLSQDQQQKMASEIAGKAPTVQAHQGLDKEGTQLLLEEMKEAEKGREAEQKERLETQKQEWAERRDTFKAQQAKSLEDMKERHSETLQSMRDAQQNALTDKRIAAEFKALGMKEADKYKVTPSELNKSMNSVVSSLNSQYSAAQANVRKLEDNVTKLQKMAQDKGLLKFWKDDPDIQGAQDDLKEAKAQAQRYKAGSDFIAKNRQKVVTGKADWDEVLGQAQSIMQGDLSDLGGEPVK